MLLCLKGETMRATILLVLALPWLASSACANDMRSLLRAYPDFLDRIEGNDLVWKDGTRMAISDGKSGKSEDQLLDAPDLDDMFAYAYPGAIPGALPPNDPGRIRHQAFFAKMYGDCQKGGVKRDLVAVNWLPRHKGGTVMVSRINGAAKALQRVSDELDGQPAAIIKTLKPSAGTFNCRVIAGTNRPSAHGLGVAIDINTAVSDYWRWQKKGYRNQIPDVVVKTFEKHGFIWGGKWKHYDTMHFEYRPELL
jgi:D-alanyl-D-alanine carboxypeptidase